MDEFDFTDDEIRDELSKLGFNNIPTTRLRDFRRDLERLVREEKSQSSGTDTSSVSSVPVSYNSAPAVNFNPTSHVVLNPSSHLHLDRPPYESPSHHEPPQVSNDNQTLKSCLKPSATRANYPRPVQKSRSIKRKVLRKTDDGLVEVSESFTDNESVTDEMAFLEDRLRYLTVVAKKTSAQLPLRTVVSSSHRPHTASGSGVERSSLSNPDRPLSAPPDMIRPSQRPHSTYSFSNGHHGPKALISPMTYEPHLRNISKSDPVANGQKYRQGWKVNRAPGEKKHKHLRWGIREQMLYHDEVVEKKVRTYQPNGYIVPSDKKRKTLRWQIRNELAQGIKPLSMFD